MFLKPTTETPVDSFSIQQCDLAYVLWSSISLYVTREILRRSLVFLFPWSRLTPTPLHFSLISLQWEGQFIKQIGMEMLWLKWEWRIHMLPAPHQHSPVSAPNSEEHGLKTMSLDFQAESSKSSVAPSIYVHCHYLESLSELDLSLLFTRSSESVVVLVILTATVDHAHPQTGCPVVPGPS